ncbi:1,4-dihydroxy-2-naphthoate polyprenyltransferase [Sandaracinus amylolyticus]|uniref:1,4-dihydroxy-2-naphthoate octaprenyltransferase n=1 Tax=Sandaracinus amylolyticus TaxID=927083 RepID=A0A0F6YMJ9_9BACT|nr:1,4-dihydroxy-2-naphthoate polyprenyltransferase [Sandaracinus amylolyticus]AKF11438.1 1,4-dihydroxy-2-naphthoate polyprenyltransferase [Sandaracinus amylolyticus]
MTTNVQPGSTRAWLLASRPATLTAAFVPVAVGTACAAAMNGLRWDTALAALLGAFGIQIGTNFANDVFDAEKGADTEERLGPTRAVQAGLIDARAMRRGMILAFLFSTACGVYLVAQAGWPIVAIGIASILSGIAYTGGPYPLGYNGLGDVFVMIFFGFVAVCGTTFVQTGDVPAIAWWASVPVGAIATAILVVNNLRDRVTDVKAGKRTLAVRFGRTGAEIEYGLLILASYATPVAMWLEGLASPWVMLPVVTFPLAMRLFGEVRAREGAPLNATLAGTARLLLIFGVLFSIGIALG